MEFATTDTLNDTIVISEKTFFELYHIEPQESEGQLYFDGFAVRIVDIEFEQVYLQAVHGHDFEKEYC